MAAAVAAASPVNRIGTSQPPGVSSDHPTIWLRNASARSSTHRKAPPTSPVAIPAIAATTATQIRPLRRAAGGSFAPVMFLREYVAVSVIAPSGRT